MPSSTPKGIAVDSETQIPPTYNYCSSYSYSHSYSSSLDWLREEGVDKPSNRNKTECSSRKRAKNAATEEYSDTTKDLALETHATDKENTQENHFLQTTCVL